MNALEISDIYADMAAKTKDLRWKRHLTEMATRFREEWFKKN